MASAEVVAEVIEAVGEETLEAADTVRRFTGENVSFFGGGVVVGAVTGVVVGGWIIKKRLSTKYEEIVADEIAEMRDHYDRKLLALENQEEKNPLDQVVQEQKYATEENGGDGRVAYHRVGSEPDKALAEDIEQEDADAVDPNVTNVFETEQSEVVTPGWDYNKEVASRTMDKAFVIHRDEFMENRWDYGTSSLTYFEGDDVLSDERDRVIEDQDVVGIENLGKFGHGSNDPDLVYICNPVLSMLIEVTHSDGKFATEVHGFTEDDLQHSSVRRRPPRRSRYDDSD